jgi:transposase-like protein
LRPKGDEIVSELNQLIIQYRREIPGGRRAWPQSIQSRVRNLFHQGMPIARIARAIGLSYHTVLNWVPKEDRQRDRSRRQASRASDGHFSEIEIRPERDIATVTVPVRTFVGATSRAERKPDETATVTVTLPGGIRVEGVTPEFLRAWFGQGVPS